MSKGILLSRSPRQKPGRVRGQSSMASSAIFDKIPLLSPYRFGQKPSKQPKNLLQGRQITLDNSARQQARRAALISPQRSLLETEQKMKNQVSSSVFVLFFFLLLLTKWSSVEAQTCKPSAKIRGKRAPQGRCNRENHSECCEEGKHYTAYKCSPPVSIRTKAKLTINSFEKGGDGGAQSECDNKYHPDHTPVVALSTGWFKNKKRCMDFITIYGNGRSVKAMVVDECDSTIGCDADHDYQPPCSNNIVDASEAVWKALGVPETDRGELDIYWSDA